MDEARDVAKFEALSPDDKARAAMGMPHERPSLFVLRGPGCLILGSQYGSPRPQWAFFPSLDVIEYREVLSPDPRDAEIAELKQIVASQDAANLAATERVGMPPFGCDTADHLADEIEKLRLALSGRDDGVAMVAAERERQVTVERWTPEHDAQHVKGELSSAAASYANCAHLQVGYGDHRLWHILKTAPGDWPWARKWWKPSKDPICNLVKAGALICAEIDRLRAAQGGK